MSFDVKLTIYEGSGQVRDIPITSRRMSIGRGSDNDLTIDDQGLSRRHLLLDIYDDAVQLTDCGTQNGTMVNRQPLIGSTRLKDGDSILIGYACDIRVQIRQANHRVAGNLQSGGSANITANNSASYGNQPTNSSNVLMIAIISCIGIFVAAGLVILILNLGNDEGKKIPPKNVGIVTPPPDNDSNRNDIPVIDTPKNNNETAISDGPTNTPANKMVEELGARVLSRISKDKQRYIFRESALRDIGQTIERLKNSGNTASAIASIKQRKGRIIEMSKGLNLADGYAIYMVLAESENRGGEGDAAILRALAFVSTTFGAGTAENALVALAAYKEGQGTVRSHPLLARLRRGRIDPQTQRNIWYLHEHKIIGDEQYQFVLKFLALGIIAENPRFFGINTEALAF
jgi:hypothetical protein